MDNEIFELVRAVFILFFLCFSIYTNYKQRRLIKKQSEIIKDLNQTAISLHHDYKLMCGLYRNGLAVRDELIKAHGIGGR